MTDKREHLVSWLKDAYAMEQQAIENCERQAGRIEHYPELRDRVAQHLEETKGQAEKIRQCLERLGEDPSGFKTGMGKLMGNLQAMGTMFSGDEVVKNTLASYVFEHMEIGSYKELIAAAEEAGEPEVARVCEEILQQEEAMADWLENHMPSVTVEFLQRDAGGMEAKV